MIAELPATRARDRLAATPPAVLLDVREPWEFAIAAIPGAKLVPLATLPGALADLDPAAETIVVCHHGVRSWHACQYLAQAGFTRVANLAGGIEAWSLEVDPAVPRY